MIEHLPETAWAEGKVGLFPLPEWVYRPAPGVNQTALKSMLRSPAHCRAAMTVPSEPTDAMLIGTLAHLACLEPDSYGDGVSHFTKPNGMSFATKEGKEWRAAHTRLPIISPSDASNLDGMRDSVRGHEVAGRLIERGVCELAAFATCQQTSLLLKAKLDKVFLDGSGAIWIADLKKVQDARDFARAAINFRYDLQAAFYMDISQLCGLDVAGFIFLVVEEAAPHGVIVYKPSPEFLANGRRLYVAALEKYAECELGNKWPSYREDIEILDLPAWAK